jgi:hypothetical protein
MKTITEATAVHTDGVGQVAQATIKASAKLFNFFADQIYANKYVAIWRELVSNGIDAQKINGNTTSPLITLPSRLDPIAKVRDYGTGMGHEFMMNKFMAFTDASTKENSNDFIGGFGIGSKAPLAYTEQYSIKCYQSGVLRIYSVFKDETGCPAIAFLAEDNTHEPDGVEVSFPVRQDDIEAFNDVVIDTFQYFDPLPRLENTVLELTPVHYDSRGPNWGLNLSSGRSQIIIGGVAYPLNIQEMSYNQKSKYEKLVDLASFGIDIYLPIGEANIALSREHVTHDDALYEKLNKIMESIGEEFGKQISKSFEEADSLWDAKKKLAEALSKEASYTTRYKMIKKYATYQGESFSTEIRKPDSEKYPISVIFYGSFGYSDNVRNLPTTQAENPKFRLWDPTGSFQPRSIDRIVIDDAKDKPILRLRQCIKDHSGERILVLRDESEKSNLNWVEFLKELGCPPQNMVDRLSNYEPLKVLRAPSTGNYTARPFKVYLGTRYLGTRAPYRGSSTVSSSLPTDGGLYVCMDNFSPLSTDKNIRTALLADPANIAWLNKTDFENSDVENNPLWVSVDEAVEKVKTEYRAKHARLPWAEAYYQWENSAQNSFGDQLDTWSKLNKFPKRGPLAQLNALRTEFKDVTDSGNSIVRNDLLGVNYEKQLAKIKQLADQARKKHPFLFELSTLGDYSARKLSTAFWNMLF